MNIKKIGLIIISAFVVSGCGNDQVIDNEESTNERFTEKDNLISVGETTGEIISYDFNESVYTLSIDSDNDHIADINLLINELTNKEDSIEIFNSAYINCTFNSDDVCLDVVNYDTPLETDEVSLVLKKYETFFSIIRSDGMIILVNNNDELDTELVEGETYDFNLGNLEYDETEKLFRADVEKIND